MKETKRDKFNKAVILAYAELCGSRDGLNNALGNELCDKCYELNTAPEIAAEMLLLVDKTEHLKKVVLEYARLGGTREGLDDYIIIKAIEGGYYVSEDPETTATALVELGKSWLHLG